MAETVECRGYTGAPLEARDLGNKKEISGYAIVWDSLSQDLGGYRELVRRGAVDRTLKDIRDGKKTLTARFQHQGGITTVGSTGNDTLTLTPDDIGLHYRAIVPDNVFGHAAWVAVKDRYVTGSSFAYIARPGGIKRDFSTSPPTYELLDIELFDVAPVDGPAYLESTAEARNFTRDNIEAKTVSTESKNSIEVKALDNGKKHVELRLYDEIVPTWISRYMTDAMSSGKVAEELAAVPDAERIDVYINSPGGSVFEGMAIYETLKAHPASVNVHIQGLAASIASVIAMAGDSIHIGRGGFIMVHDAWSIVQGNSADLRTEALLLDKINLSIADVVANRSGNETDTVADWMSKETWFSAQEAVDAGLADRISGDAEVSDTVSNRCREMHYRNIPDTLGGSLPRPNVAMPTNAELRAITQAKLNRR